MSRAYASHPSDSTASAGASKTSAPALTESYEDVFDVVEARYGKLSGYGALQALCSLAIARVAFLERELARQTVRGPRLRRVTPARLVSVRVRDELRARDQLYGRTGEVIALPTGGRGGERS